MVPTEVSVPPGAINEDVRELARLIDQGSCQLHGAVDECCNCTYQDVDRLNERHVHPVLSKLVKSAFFRFFKVNIYCDCPLWPEDSMCAMHACSVCECDDNEVPRPWLADEAAGPASCAKALEPECSTADCGLEMTEFRVNQTVDPAIRSKLLNLKGWRGINNPWMAPNEEAENEEYLYINLVVNPERYTGYKGEHAHRIWSAIYSQSCFSNINCTEKRVFYRLISGMHASISAHLSAEYLLDEERNIWGPNLQEFRQRLGTPETRQRVQNLYFGYLFVLRAVMKAAPLLQRFEYVTGLPEEDRATQRFMEQLLTTSQLKESCPMPFDEGRLWKGSEGPELRKTLQVAFQNITRIMDCVGCEKCKLWGKLQTLGIATALKVLFSASNCDVEAAGGQDALQPLQPPAADDITDLRLERNEVIALLNLLARFSNSLQIYHSLSRQLEQQQGLQPLVAAEEAVA